MNMRIGSLLLIGLSLALSTLVVLHNSPKTKSGSTELQEDVVAWVNNEPVGRQEMASITALSGISASTSSQREMAEALARIKTVQQEATRNHLLVEDTYANFLIEWREENARRATAIEKNEVIYGPKELTELAYYNYRQSYLYNKLQKLWVDNVADLSEQSMRLYYDQHRDELARKPDSVTVYKIMEPIPQGANSRAAVEKRIRDIRRKLDEGADFIELYQAWLENGGAVETETIDERNVSETAKYRNEFYNMIIGMKQGDTSGIIELNGSFTLVYVAERKEQGFKSFEEIREEVKNQYLDTGFDAYISEKASSAQIRFAPSIGAGKREGKK